MIDLADINQIVISHGHYDHTGWLHHVFFSSSGVDRITQPDIFDNKYVELSDSMQLLEETILDSERYNIKSTL